MFKQLAAVPILAAALFTVPASAQSTSDSLSQGMVEMASLSVEPRESRSIKSASNGVPIPTPRPETIRNIAPREPVERTAEGYRLIGPRFFPAQ
jgi:hypothetical protein